MCPNLSVLLLDVESFDGNNLGHPERFAQPHTLFSRRGAKCDESVAVGTTCRNFNGLSLSVKSLQPWIIGLSQIASR